MKKLIFILCTLPILSLANCKVFVPKHTFYAVDRYLNFDFTKLFLTLGYEETFNQNEAQYLLHILGSETTSGHFKVASGGFQIDDLRGEIVSKINNSKKCMTQSCALSDFSKVFSKSYSEALNSFDQCN